ncbi:MAG: FAD-linked oxidase C-terminal domain-containing protein [Dehalococcoidia bacterium]
MDAPRPLTLPVRRVVRGQTASAHASVQHALDLLDAAPATLERLAADLAAGLAGGASDVLIDRGSRLLYATDASIYEMEPLAIVFPRGAPDIQHVVRVAAAQGVPILTRGAGTSLAGQAVNHAIVIDCSRHMNRVLEVNAADRWARVEPGVVLDQLSRAARPHGLQYGIDPATRNRATIGGGIGNNSCGAHSLIYGKTVDQVIAVDVVLADGSLATFEETDGGDLLEQMSTPGLEGDIYRGVRRVAHRERAEIAARYPGIQRRVSGYNLDEFTGEGAMNLARMIVGSEGTLAIVVEARVRLVPVPALKGVAALHFRSVVEACRATPEALKLQAASIEVIDDTIIRRCRESIGYADLADFVRGEAGALLMIEVYADDPGELRAHLDSIERDMVGRGIAYDCVTTTDAREQARMWRMREAGLGLLMSMRGDAKPIAYVEDTAVAPERLGDFVERFDAIVRAHGTEAAHYGHASVGCLHIRPVVNIKSDAGATTMQAIASEVADLVIEFGGSLSGEHGDGILRGVFTERMFGARLTEAFREVKRTFDPAGILNPGKIIDTPPLLDNLRLGPATVNAQPRTVLDWAREGGLARAAEQCNGQGICLKHEGTMCPSFMVTHDEEHSTRGRANLLRQALNGALPADALAGDRLQQALDLCVECKACKAECASGVDLAKLKYEVLTAYHDAHGVPLRARLFGHMATWSRLGSMAGPLVPLINLGASLPPVRALLHRLGIHRDRPLPRLAREPFRRWWARRPRASTPAPRGEVVLYDDTFVRYYHPEVGQAAVRVLEALGYAVTVLDRLGCCGRPLISKGQLHTARDWAARNVEALAPYAERGVPIVGTEPSCLLSLRDEYPELLRSAPARAVAAQAWLLEELAARVARQDPAVRDRFSIALDRAAVLHGHCHQKALAGMDPTLEALGLVPGLTTSLVDSACCGMAGAFGFEAEHYEVSRAMGERSLFPAIAAAPDAEVVVTGVSCRQQIAHFTGRAPRHVAEVLADALAPL